jgi:hypothetical protein
LEKVLFMVQLAPGDVMMASRQGGFGPFGRWGLTVTDALKADFFTYFRLGQVSRAEGANGASMLTFKPAAVTVAPMVTVRLYVNGGGRITDADLILDRRFIDDPKTELGARDWAQSFIEGTATPQDYDAVVQLHDELVYLSSKPVVVGTGVKPKIPIYPTVGYETYKGRQINFNQMLSTSRLWMENALYDGRPALLMSVGTSQ